MALKLVGVIVHIHANFGKGSFFFSVPTLWLHLNLVLGQLKDKVRDKNYVYHSIPMREHVKMLKCSVYSLQCCRFAAAEPRLP